MTNLNLEEQMDQLHHQLNKYKLIQGSLLLTDNGLHISSKLPEELPEHRYISAEIARIFRYFKQISGISELDFKLWGTHIHLKYIPSKQVILTTMTNQSNSPHLKRIMQRYSQKFESLFL